MTRPSQRSRIARFQPVRRWLFLSLPFLLFLTLPLLALLWNTPATQFQATLSQPVVTQAIDLSLRTSLVATLLTVLFGTPLAYLIAWHHFPGRRVLDALLDLPTVLPPAVAGVALLMAFGRRGLVGTVLDDIGLTITFTQAAVVMAQIFVASPFYLRTVIVAFASIEPELLQAASLDGAGEWGTFRHVILPLARTALFSGAVMTWARALGEFGATIIFAGNLPGRTQTMPLAIYLGFEMNLDVALTLSVILLALSFVVLFSVRTLSSPPQE